MESWVPAIRDRDRGANWLPRLELLLLLPLRNGPNHNNHPGILTFNDNRCFFILFFSGRQLKPKFELLNPNPI